MKDFAYVVLSIIVYIITVSIPIVMVMITIPAFYVFLIPACLLSFFFNCYSYIRLFNEVEVSQEKLFNNTGMFNKQDSQK